MGEEVKMTRVWAMPSRHTFTIPPISRLVKRYVGDGIGWVDPFAGENSPAEFTNDVNPSKPTKFHMDAHEMGGVLPQEIDGVLFDPPYSLEQLKRSYDDIGRRFTMRDGQTANRWTGVKKMLAPRIKPLGITICFGWNSNGFGKNLGFELEEILLVAHGAGHNDTIVTVERKSSQECLYTTNLVINRLNTKEGK